MTPEQFAQVIGHTRATVPPTFVIGPVLEAVEELVRGDDLGLDYDRIVHRAQRIHHLRPCTDRVEVRARTLDVRSFRGNVIGRFSVELHDDAGVVCSALTTLVQGGAPAAPGKATEAVPLGRVFVDQDLVTRYADASGDHNPIHLDPAAARAAGFPGVIAHGMLTAGLALSLVPRDLTWFEAVFTQPVVVGSGVHLDVGARAGRDAVEIVVACDGVAVAHVRTDLSPAALTEWNGSTP
ncbi:MaoC/PaaZ C-terminal domain-containing protein [Lentzea sp. NBRC 102530]|uniref:MaoC family dehydratase n=1 Tax=Lentzea sp. NBRC 102530 TaxID=3032201 RepID=UPI0024A13632|nr:MaoC/PaaZ C-terminal domain-containing protein [Lentzea sp. NBRC 102530]GLY46852.1 hypothetical protein Lesp01_05080 [Lentzea sp. NBRC 102530]